MSTLFSFVVSILCQKLQFLEIMLHPSSPKHNDKPDTKEWIDKFGKLFQSLDSIFIFLLQSFIFVKFLKCLFLFLLIDIDKLIPSEMQFYVLVDHVLRRRKKECDLGVSRVQKYRHTSYLSRKPQEFSCKFFLAGVIFYRFNAKNWQFTVYFAVITQKIGNFLCILS